MRKSKEHWFAKEDIKRETREIELAKMLDQKEIHQPLYRPNYRFNNYENEEEVRDIWHTTLLITSDKNENPPKLIEDKSRQLNIAELDMQDPIEKRASMIVNSINKAITE